MFGLGYYGGDVVLEKVKIPSYTLGEELVNSISHGIGAGLSIAGMVVLIVHASGAINIVTSVIYGVSLIILYIISCIYHALSPRVKGKKVFRVLDHCSVLLLEAGTYTPICLGLFGGVLGWILFGIVWGITIFVIVCNAISVDQFNVISVVCNLVMGWGVLFLLPILLELCTLKGIVFLIIGGFLYSVGAILYGVGSKVPYMHSVFHFFVIAGSLFHYFFIYLYVV